MLHGERRWIQTDEVTDRVVVAPLGSLEQHGHHLPLLTDTLIITEIARRAESELGGNGVNSWLQNCQIRPAPSIQRKFPDGGGIDHGTDA